MNGKTGQVLAAAIALTAGVADVYHPDFLRPDYMTRALPAVRMPSS